MFSGQTNVAFVRDLIGKVVFYLLLHSDSCRALQGVFPYLVNQCSSHQSSALLYDVDIPSGKRSWQKWLVSI